MLFLTGVVVLYFFSITPTRKWLVTPLTGSPAPNLDNLRVGAIVVLGGNPERLITGIRLINEKVSPVIIVSGGSGEFFNEPEKESHMMEDLLVEFGVLKQKIIVEARSRNTRENALYTKQILDSLEVKTIALVTSSLHMPRAEGVFRKTGIVVHPVKARFYRKRRKIIHIDPFQLVPNVENLSVSSRAIYEYTAIFFYKINGWL
ncbi:MAG: YdcF family protein [Candidatus Neomarinimicrobiota bacterium]